jgi:hypothetical protein
MLLALFSLLGGIKMNNIELANKCKEIATKYKTLYVMGCFGAPMTATNKKRYINHHSYNQKTARKNMINAATEDTFGFDCVCLIKGILWGWNGNKNAVYGGAGYAINDVPDIGADSMINVCSKVSTDFSKIEIGEAVWCKGHIGIYIGDGLAVECTPSWDNCVQITAVKNIGSKAGYNARKWTKHGKLPYVDYVEKAVETKVEELKVGDKVTLAADAVYYNGVKIPNWVKKMTLYVREVAKDRIVISVLKVGAITGAVHKKYLKKK